MFWRNIFLRCVSVISTLWRKKIHENNSCAKISNKIDFTKILQTISWWGRTCEATCVQLFFRLQIYPTTSQIIWTYQIKSIAWVAWSCTLLLYFFQSRWNDVAWKTRRKVCDKKPNFSSYFSPFFTSFSDYFCTEHVSIQWSLKAIFLYFASVTRVFQWSQGVNSILKINYVPCWKKNKLCAYCLPNKSSSSVIDRLTKRDHHWKRWRKSTNLRFDFVCHESFFHTLTLAIKLSFYFVIIYFYFSQLKNDYTTKFKTKWSDAGKYNQRIWIFHQSFMKSTKRNLWWYAFSILLQITNPFLPKSNSNQQKLLVVNVDASIKRSKQKLWQKQFQITCWKKKYFHCFLPQIRFEFNSNQC